MKAPRLYAPELPAHGGTLSLPRDSAEHAQVLRLKVGARVRLFDGALGEADATITALGRRDATCQAQPPQRVTLAPPHVTALIAIPKQGRLETMTRMLTELGVHAIRPVITERTVARADAGSARIERCRRIALQACAQSGQPWAPQVHAPEPLLSAAAQMPNDATGIVFWEEGGAALETLALRSNAPPPRVWLVIGPEGGLTADEVASLDTHGYSRVGLGSAVLRVDTAAAVAVALVLDRCGRLRDTTPPPGEHT